MHYRVNGKWMKTRNCSYHIAFGSSDKYKAGCRHYLHKLHPSTNDWLPLGILQVIRVAADSNNTPYAVRKGERDVVRWDVDREEWVEMGLEKAAYVAAGNS